MILWFYDFFPCPHCNTFGKLCLIHFQHCRTFPETTLTSFKFCLQCEQTGRCPKAALPEAVDGLHSAVLCWKRQFCATSAHTQPREDVPTSISSRESGAERTGAAVPWLSVLCCAPRSALCVLTLCSCLLQKHLNVSAYFFPRQNQYLLDTIMRNDGCAAGGMRARKIILRHRPVVSEREEAQSGLKNPPSDQNAVANRMHFECWCDVELTPRSGARVDKGSKWEPRASCCCCSMHVSLMLKYGSVGASSRLNLPLHRISW